MSDYCNYPRVTTIISETEPPEKRKKLLRWMKKLEKVHGVEGAERERQAILDNGTSVHDSIEKFLTESPDYNGLHPQAVSLYGFLNNLKHSNNELMIVEQRLYCHKYKFQGKPDLICELNGLPTIIDWTTSAKWKKKEWVEHKFLQAGAYAIACDEMNLPIKQLAVVSICNNPRTYQLFTEPPKQWRIDFLKRLGEYQALCQR
jgi:hypothetical protein